MRNEQPPEGAPHGAVPLLLASRRYSLLLVMGQFLVDATFFMLALGSLARDSQTVERFIGNALWPLILGVILVWGAFPKSVRRSEEWDLAVWQPRLCRAAFVGIGAPASLFELRLAINVVSAVMLVVSVVR